MEGLDFKLPPGGIVGVIGPNGAGKTTLFKMIIGKETPDAGAFRLGETVKLGYVDQSRDALDPKKNVWEEVSGGLDQMKLGNREVNSRAYCGWFNFKGPDQQKKVGQLSGGERNRVHLAKMLKEGGNLMLLDEPTNDLDMETLSSLEAALEDFPGCAVVIGHDRFFLDRLAPTSWPSRATATSSGSRAISRPMRRTSCAASAPPHSIRRRQSLFASREGNSHPVKLTNK